MIPSLRISRFGLVILCLVFAATVPATANSVSVSGTSLVGNDFSDFNVTAGNFTAFGGSPGGNSSVGLGTFGVPLTLEWGAPAYSGPDFAQVTVGNQFTDVLSGGLFFTSTFTIPASALLSGTFTAPVNVSGFLSAYQDLTLGQGYWTQGPFMGGVTFTGTGTATFSFSDAGLNLYLIDLASVDFTGTGTVQSVTPEPTSLVLMGTGLAAVALVLRRKRSTFQATNSQPFIDRG